MWHGTNSEKAELLKVTSLDFAENDELIKEIKADYDFIREKLTKHGFESLTGKRREMDTGEDKRNWRNKSKNRKTSTNYSCVLRKNRFS